VGGAGALITERSELLVTPGRIVVYANLRTCEPLGEEARLRCLGAEGNVAELTLRLHIRCERVPDGVGLRYDVARYAEIAQVSLDDLGRRRALSLGRIVANG